MSFSSGLYLRGCGPSGLGSGASCLMWNRSFRSETGRRRRRTVIATKKSVGIRSM